MNSALFVGSMFYGGGGANANVFFVCGFARIALLMSSSSLSIVVVVVSHKLMGAPSDGSKKHFIIIIIIQFQAPNSSSLFLPFLAFISVRERKKNAIQFWVFFSSSCKHKKWLFPAGRSIFPSEENKMSAFFMVITTEDARAVVSFCTANGK